jgi:hypothetical protein
MSQMAGVDSCPDRGRLSQAWSGIDLPGSFEVDRASIAGEAFPGTARNEMKAVGVAVTSQVAVAIHFVQFEGLAFARHGPWTEQIDAVHFGERHVCFLSSLEG